MAETSVLQRVPTWGKFLAGGVLVALIGAGYSFVFHSDISTQIERARKQTKDLEAELQLQKEAQASYLADRDELATRQQKQKDLNKALPEETEPASFLSAIQQVANVSGVDLKAWSPLDEQPQAFFARVPMKVELTGRYHQIAKFLYEVGRQDRIINMENVELSDPKPSGEDVLLRARCLATTFHLVKAKPKAPAAPGTPGAPGAAPAPGLPAAPGGKP